MTVLFDSLAHPTIDGNWLGKNMGATFASLSDSLKRFDFIGGCAVGIAGSSSYSHNTFIQECNKYKSLVPIAGFDPNLSDLGKEMKLIKDLGFKGIKIHPRFSGIDLKSNNLIEVFKAAYSQNLVIFYCTYYHCQLHNYPESDPFYFLVSLLKSVPKAKVVLVHGGDVQLLRYAELVNFNQNLLLDLSFTIMRYQNSSVDLDIKYLFKNLDKRICVGSDYPEYSHEELCKRFDYFSDGLSSDKIENIGFKNLKTYLNI